MIITEISHRTPALLEQLLEIWERSVRATHTFLSEAEILRIREYVPCALSQTPCLVTAELTPCRPVAFMGLDRENLEMLFVAPEARGQGIGGQLAWWLSMSKTRRPWDFTGIWAFKSIEGPPATNRVAPIPSYI